MNRAALLAALLLLLLPATCLAQATQEAPEPDPGAEAPASLDAGSADEASAGEPAPVAASAVTPAASEGPSPDRSAGPETGDDARAAGSTAVPLLTERRPVPDYTGREHAGPTAEEVLVWFPRILFSPITLVLDFGIRRPLGFLVETAEREAWDAFLLDLFTWNERKSGFTPTFFVAFGLQPSVGFTYWSNDEIAEGHQVRLSGAFGGVDFLTGAGAYRVTFEQGRGAIGVRLGGGRRPDGVFSGIGWDAAPEQYRFREASYRGSLTLQLRYWRQSTLRLEAGVDGREFDPDGYAAFATNPNNQRLSTAVEQGLVDSPPGLEGYVAYRQRMELSIDTREREPAPGHGLRVQAHGEIAFDLNEPTQRQWIRYGGAIGGFVDLGHRRVLGLWGLAHFADSLSASPVPFTELVTFGSEHLLMQGFLQGQLRGRSGVASTLEYTYPIWTQIDGRLHFSVGNVFGEHLEDFSFERLRMSFGLGFSTVGDPDNSFQFGVAAGSSPFAHGPAIESVQLVMGGRQGF